MVIRAVRMMIHFSKVVIHFEKMVKAAARMVAAFRQVIARLPSLGTKTLYLIGRENQVIAQRPPLIRAQPSIPGRSAGME